MNENLQNFLSEQYQIRVAKNPSYSLRSFAHTLKMNAGTVSALMNGKRPFTRKTVETICDRLAIEPTKQRALLTLIAKYRATRGETNSDSNLRDGIDEARIRLDHEIYKAIAEWHHWAILQLVRLDDYGKDPQHATAKWFAGQLGVNETQIKIALDRLVEIGLLRIENNFYFRTNEKVTTRDRSVTSPALRAWQKSLREKSIESLENDPIELRSMTSMAMAIDVNKLKEARLLIEEFQEKMSAFLESGKKEYIYQMTVSLFPLQKMENS